VSLNLKKEDGKNQGVGVKAEGALETNEAKVDRLRLELKEVKSSISDLRKKGYDPLMADYILVSIKAKIQWAKVNDKAEDFQVVEDLLETVRKEIKEVAEKEPMNVKKEINELTKLKLGEDKSFEAKPEEIKPAPKVEIDTETKQQEQPVVVETKNFKDKTLTNYEEFFHLKNGMDLKSINELIQYLPSMPAEEFNFFVRNYDNDFSMWIEYVFFYPELAKKIKGVNDNKLMAYVLKEEVEVE